MVCFVLATLNAGATAVTKNLLHPARPSRAAGSFVGPYPARPLRAQIRTFADNNADPKSDIISDVVDLHLPRRDTLQRGYFLQVTSRSQARQDLRR